MDYKHKELIMRKFGRMVWFYGILVFCVLESSSCSSGPKTYAYSDSTIPLEEQSLLHPWTNSFTITSFDGNPVNWKGGAFTENLYYIPSGTHTIVFSYHHEYTSGSYRYTTHYDNITLRYNFLPGGIYTVMNGSENGKDVFFIRIDGFTEWYVPSEGETLLVFLNQYNVHVDGIDYGYSTYKPVRVAVKNGQHTVWGKQIDTNGGIMYFDKNINQISAP